MLKKILFVILALAVAGGIIGYKMYNKPFEKVESVKPVATLDAAALLSAYQADEQKANESYLDQFIDVTGKVESVVQEDNVWTVILDANDMMASVRCEMDYIQGDNKPSVSSGEMVTLRGKCTGILMDVVLVRCIEVNK